MRLLLHIGLTFLALGVFALVVRGDVCTGGISTADGSARIVGVYCTDCGGRHVVPSATGGLNGSPAVLTSVMYMGTQGKLNNFTWPQYVQKMQAFAY